MAVSQQKVYFITEAQRDFLIRYLQNHPFKDVSGAIQFLTYAPTAMLNMQPKEGDADGDNADNNSNPAPSPDQSQQSQEDADSALKFG